MKSIITILVAMIISATFIQSIAWIKGNSYIERVSEDRMISSKEAKSSFTTFNPRSVYTQNTLLEITIEPSGMFPFFNRRVDTLSQKYYENQ